MARVVRTWHPVGGVIGATIAACFAKPAGPELRIDAGDAVDAIAADAAPLTCETHNFGANGAGCDTFGSGSGSAYTSNGELVLNVGSGSGFAQSSCETLTGQPFVLGALHIVSLPATTVYRRTRFLLDVNGQNFGLQLDQQGIAPYCNAAVGVHVSYNRADTPYVWLVATPPNLLAVKVSSGPTSATWQNAGACMVDPLDNVRAGLELERSSGSDSGFVVKFESVEICY